MTKLAVGGILGALLVLVAGYGMSIFGRPPRPVPFGTVVWAYETGFSVSNVARHRSSPGTTAYDVTVRVFCPYGERYAWTPRTAHVIDNDGRPYFAVSATPTHRILGATHTEQMTCQCPHAIEQPALGFDDPLGMGGFTHSLMAGPPEFYERRRF